MTNRDVVQNLKGDQLILLHDPAGAFLSLFQSFHDHNAHAVAFFVNNKINAHMSSKGLRMLRPLRMPLFGRYPPWPEGKISAYDTPSLA